MKGARMTPRLQQYKTESKLQDSTLSSVSCTENKPH